MIEEDPFEEFEDWKPLLKVIMELKQLRAENEALKIQIRALNSAFREQNCTYAQH